MGLPLKRSLMSLVQPRYVCERETEREENERMEEGDEEIKGDRGRLTERRRENGDDGQRKNMEKI